MKHLLTILSGLLVALLFARCADDDNLSGGIDGLPERGIVIRLSTGELDTRTQLTSTGDYHHVEEVWAVLYKLEEGTDANDLNNYKLKGNPTKLGSMEDGQFVAWNPYKAPDAPKFNPADPDNPTDAEREKYEQELAEYNNKWGGEYGNGKVQGREFVLPESGAMTAGTYRVLCIGLDDKSGEVYDLKKDGNLNLGSTLAEAKAKMTIDTKAYEEQTGTYNMYEYDGTGELFAGWTEFEFEPDNINIAEVELKRRVAGILCYVTDIPAKIEDTEVKGIRLCLNTKANSEIGLCRLDKPWEDFGVGSGYSSEYAGGTTLAYQDLTGWERQSGGEILVKDEDGTEVKNLVMGAYIIPINVVEDNNVTNTLSVQLFGGDSYDYENGNLGELIKTFNVLNDTERGETAERYNILPNYIYHIGNKDDDTDEPMSLLGQKITVVPKVWTGETIPVEFPSVPIYNTMRLVYPTNPGDIENTEWVGYGDDYVFDCIGIDDDNNSAYKADYYMGAPYDKRLYLEVSPSVLKDGWTLRISGNDNATSADDNERMLYFSTKNGDGTYTYSDEGYTSEGKETVYVPLLLTSYASEDGDDIRTVTIELTPEGESTPKTSLEVEQYNAIIVTWDDGKEKRGFSREDWNDGATVQWGYDGIVITEVYAQTSTGDSDYGERNLSLARNRGRDEFFESAIYKCGRIFISVNNSLKKVGDKGRNWFLPAPSELNAFLTTQIKDGVTYSDNYWSSRGFGSKRAFYNGIEGSELKVGEAYVLGNTIERINTYRMRPACLISRNSTP